MSSNKEAIEKAEKLQVYWILDRRKTTDSPELLSAVDRLISEMESAGVLAPTVLGKYRQNLVDHVRVILCNLYRAYDTDQNLYIAHHLDRNMYKADPAYRGFQFGYTNTFKAVNFLRASGYIEWHTGYKALVPEKDSQLSKMRVTDKLVELIEGYLTPEVPAAIYRDCTYKEAVIRKGKKKLPPKRDWKDGKKPKPQRQIITTPNNPTVRRMRNALDVINGVIQSCEIELNVDQHELEQINKLLSADPDKYTRPIDFTMKYLYRVFIDGSLKSHGRFYGGWWEGIAEDDRELILINGMPSTELDYSAIHPHILYGLEGILLPEKDPYSLPGYEKLRKFVKKFLLIALNAKNVEGALSALRWGYTKARKKAKKRGESFVPPPFKITTANMAPIIEKMLEQHAPIHQYFFADSGNMLMYHDSLMAEEVMLHFARMGMPCLPVHDSFIVDIRAEKECWEAMRKAFKHRYDQDIHVDICDLKKTADRILSEPKNGAMNKVWKEMSSELTWDIKGDDDIFRRVR